MRSHARVVVIGGGAVGASCLYHLAQAGIGDCLLLEKDELTSGSTWHAAGNVPTYANSWLGMRAGNYAWRLYGELGERLNYPITYRHTGAFWPAHTRDRMDLYHHLVGVSRSAGFELAMLSPGDMEAMHPYYAAGDTVIGGIHDPYEGDIDPGQLTQALARGARDGGAEIARFTRVTGIERSGSGEWKIATDKGDVRCETVVNATGFYGDQVAGYARQQLPIVTLQHQYLVTDPLAPLEQDQALFPLVRDPDICFYLRRERASFLFGSYGHAGRPAFGDGLPDDFAHQLFADSIDDIADVLDAAIGHVPLLAEAGVQRFVNGPISYSADAQPICGPAFELPNFYHACGIQIGITHAAAVGKSITEWITQGETEWDLSTWDPRRFGDWASPGYARERVIELYDLQYAIPFPHRLLASARPVQTTPLYPTLRERGAVFGQIGGWERALWFNPGRKLDEQALSFREEPWQQAVQRECEAVRDGVGIMDHGGFTKYEVSGAGAAAFLDRVFCGRLPPVGRLKLSYMLTPQGMLWSEATIARLREDHFLLCGPTLADRRDYDWLQRHLPGDGSVQLRMGSDRDAALMVMGPHARALLARLTAADLSATAAPWLAALQIDVAGRAATALRVSYVGEWGVELHLASHDLAHVYTALHDAGSDMLLTDFGSYALNAMRIEKGFHGWGTDFGTEYTLFDADLERFANLDKGEFIGRDAFLRQSERAPDWRFTGFVLEDGDADALAGDPIYAGDELVGYVTSGSTGFRLDKRLALGYLEQRPVEPGDTVEIVILGKRRKATVATLPFYDANNERMRN